MIRKPLQLNNRAPLRCCNKYSAVEKQGEATCGGDKFSAPNHKTAYQPRELVTFTTAKTEERYF